MTALDTASDFYTKAQQTLRHARDEGPTPLGQKMLRLGGSMLDGHEFNALPEQVQGDLCALYAEAEFVVRGSLA